MKRSSRRGLLAGLAMAPLVAPRSVLAFPDRPVRILVPFGPGGFADVLARFMAEALAPRLGQPVAVENRPGAGGNIAAEALVRAQPDGHTLLLAGQTITSINPALYARLPFSAETDFATVALLAEVPNLALGGPGTPGATIGDLIAAARTRPAALSYGSVGPGSLTHLAAAMLCAAADITMEHVPYRTAGAAQADLQAGRIHLLFESAGSALGLVRGGGLRALGVAAASRLPELPDVPAIAETLPGYEAVGWYGLLAAAATPATMLARLRSESAAILASAAFAAFLAARAARPMAVPPDQAAAFLATDRARWGAAIRASGARAE